MGGIFMYTYTWYHWITFFYIYCFCGWIFESAYVSLKSGHFVNRGFLRLPMLPLYGTGAVMMLWFSLPFQDNIVMVYFAGVTAATLLEYVTGYVMERLFKMKYWDYSNKRYQIHGYICLTSSIAWGFLTIFLTEVIHQPIARLVRNTDPVTEFFFIGIIGVLFLTDTVQSTREALDLGRALEAMTKIKTELEDVQLQLSLLKYETGQRVAELREGTAQRVTELRDETAQRITEIRLETVQKMADMKLETAQLVSDMKEETTMRMADAAQKLKDLADLEIRLKSLTENWQTLSKQMSFYRKSILRGNPTSSSNRFADALKELKDSVGHMKNKRKTG